MTWLFATTALLSQSRAEDVDLFGYYFFMDPVPKALQDISELHLSTISMRGDEMVKVPLYGFFRFKQKNMPDIYLVKPERKGYQFSFSTKTVKGIRYQFSGKFLKLSNFPVTRPEGEVLLTGRLMKYLASKKVFDQNVNFSYSGGD